MRLKKGSRMPQGQWLRVCQSAVVSRGESNSQVGLRAAAVDLQLSFPKRSASSDRLFFQSTLLPSGRLILPAVLIAAIYVATSRPLSGQTFGDDFNYANTPLDSSSNNKWHASTNPSVVVLNNQVVAQVGSTALYMKPQFSPTGTKTPANWPLARTGENFVSVEFDLLQPVTANLDSKMLLLFESRHANGSTENYNGLADYGTLAAVQFDWLTGTSPKLTATVLVQPTNGSAADVLAKLGVPPIDLGDFSTVSTKTLKVDFGWDYFRYPHDFTNPYSVFSSQGEPWFYVRIWKLNASGNWDPTFARPHRGPGQLNGNTDGWVECGDEVKVSSDSWKIGAYRYDWSSGLGSGIPDVVYPYWYFDQVPSGTNTTWTIDNVKIHTADPPPPPYSIMANQLGYDTAGPQWAVLRANDASLRGNSSGITRIDWTLSGSGLTTQTASVNNPAGQPCFQEIADFESRATPPSTGFDGTGFTSAVQDYWWRWEWTRVTTPATGCTVKADVYVPGLTLPYTVTSDPFSISPGLAYSTLIADPTKNMVVENGVQREGQITSLTKAATGWFDANAENGENRAVAGLISAFSNRLRTQRPEMSTSELRDLIGQVVIGADFLTSEGAPENTYATTVNPVTGGINRPHQDSPGSRTDDAHDFATSTGPDPVEQAGHIWHESHFRQLGYGGDSLDGRNKGIWEWMSCASLFDAARALTPFGSSFSNPLTLGTSHVTDYTNQAIQTHTYIGWLAGHFNHMPQHPDYYFTARSMSMLDFIYSEVDPASSAFADAKNEIEGDLLQFPPTTDGNVQNYWIMAEQFSLNTGSTPHDLGSIDAPYYSPSDPLLYCIEHGIPDSTLGGVVPWLDAVHNIVDFWYDSVNHLRPSPIHWNPLRICNWWTPFAAPGDPTDDQLEEYYGDRPYRDKDVAHEGYAVARFAQVLGRADTRFARIVDLASGELNYLLGINIGIRARQVLQAPGVAPTDLEYGGVSLITGIGSHWAAQVARESHVWSETTTMSGPAGKRSSGTDWDSAPWEYSRGDSIGAETFIKTDASVIALVDTLDLALHPRLVVEAETNSSSSPIPVSNNDPTSNPPRLNGGLSLSGNGSAAQTLSYPTLVPPEPAVGSLSHYRYRFRLRAANASPSATTVVSVTVTQGTYTWFDSISVGPTTNLYEYLVFDSNSGYYSSNPLTLASGTPFAVTLTIPAGSAPWAFDDFILESEGIPR
jgi:hypothetical protein